MLSTASSPHDVSFPCSFQITVQVLGRNPFLILFTSQKNFLALFSLGSSICSRFFWSLLVSYSCSCLSSILPILLHMLFCWVAFQLFFTVIIKSIFIMWFYWYSELMIPLIFPTLCRHFRRFKQSSMWSLEPSGILFSIRVLRSISIPSRYLRSRQGMVTVYIQPSKTSHVNNLTTMRGIN